MDCEYFLDRCWWQYINLQCSVQHKQCT